MDPITSFYVICSCSWTFRETYHVVWPGFDIKTNGLKFQVITVTTMSEKMILKTGPAIGQSSVLGDKLLFDKVKAELVRVGFVAETRAMLVNIMVIMGK